MDILSGAVFGLAGGIIYSCVSYVKNMMQEKESFDILRFLKTSAGTTIIGGLAGVLSMPIDALSTMSLSTFLDICITRLYTILVFKEA